MTSGTDPGHTELPVRYDRFDGSTRSLFPTYRHYLVGKLIRQDRDTGKRQGLRCSCHDEVIKVFGPSVTDREYRAYCDQTHVLITSSETMEGLWDAITEALPPPGTTGS